MFGLFFFLFLFARLLPRALMRTCVSRAGVRLQFYAIEIARNRRGLNDKVWHDAQKASASAAS